MCLEFIEFVHHIMSMFLFISVQQSSLYGLTGMLPARYTQAAMTGESRFFQDDLVCKYYLFDQV